MNLNIFWKFFSEKFLKQIFQTKIIKNDSLSKVGKDSEQICAESGISVM